MDKIRKETINMQDKIQSAMNFYLLATKLKYKIRNGWNKEHWNINNDRIESVAEHVYGTCILAISINQEFSLDNDMEKVLKMLVLHEIGEVIIGDITPFSGKTREEKMKMEHKAMLDVLGDLSNKEELYSLLLEFDEHRTKESKFCYLCDKIEADIQAKIYQDMGLQHNLDDQEGNIIYNNPKIKEMINNGASSVFDIWYQWDKHLYQDNPIFKELLEYIKNNNLNI